MIDAAVLTPRASEAPLQAQEAADGASAPGPGIRLVDLSDYPTHTTVDRFEVEVFNLTETVAYQVIVSRDSAGLGIGACGTASQTQKVTGVAAKTLELFVYACAEGSGTLTAELRPSGSSTSVATVSQRLVVEAVPELAPGSASTSTATAKSGSATVRSPAQVGTPGTVPSISFPVRTTTSIRASWGKPSDGGWPLTGFGLLFWRTSDPDPPYSSALVKGAGDRSHVFTGLQPDTTYKFRIHACNGPDSCGWWTHPPREVTTPPEPTTTAAPTSPPTQRPTSAPGRPDAPHSLSHTRTATSFTVTWGADPNSGGASLTGFGILQWEKSDSRPPDSEATNLGADVRSKTFSGLKYGRSQGFEIRACNGSNRCSAWASLTVPAMAGLLPTIALPKTTIEIGEQISVGANDVPVGAVAWLRFEGPIQPRGRCGASGTARAPAVPRDPSPSPGPGYYDSAWIEGCEPGGDAVIRLESQNGSVLYDKRTLTVVSIKPGQVARPVVSPRDGGLHVDWAAPTSGGTPSHYDLQYRAGTSGDWTLVENITRTSYTITELTNGTSYDVQVRAANTAQNGDWSETATGTPLATAPAPPATAVPITPVDAACPETSVTETAAGPPQNLDVVPQSQRRILLCWTPVTPVTPVSGDTSYFVEATLNPTADTDGDRMWATARTRKADDSGSASTTDTAVIVDLTNVLLYTADRGLTMQQSVGFRVRATISPSRNEYSDMVVVVDSPIVAASVSRSNREEAHVSWRTAQTVLLDDDYAHGTYDLRYRLVRDHRQDRNWTQDNLGPREVETGVSSPYTLRGLNAWNIYSIQLVYRKDNRASTHDADVYAARSVYVQTIEDPPVGIYSLEPGFFAGFPMRYPLKTTTFAYRVCTETFPTGRESDWVDFIKHAFGQWELATNFTVISMRYSSDPCTDYATTDVTKTILDKIEDHTGSDVALATEVEAFIDQATTMTKLRPLHRADSRLNEVLMLDDVEALGLGPAFKSRVVWVYSQLGSDIGYLGSEDTNSVSNRCWTEYPACAVASEIVDSDGFSTGDGYTTDIFVLRSSVMGGLQLPGGDSSVDRSDVELNRCPAGTSDTYGVLIHEAGHALGLRRADGSDSHHKSSDSVMSGGDYGNKCSPYPLDVLAIRALYETR